MMAKAKSTKPTPYSIRESSRAKHVSIKVSHLGEVEIVVPRGFDLRQIPAILEKRQDWIAKTTERIAAERQLLSPTATASSTEQVLPEQLSLRSLAEEWLVAYQRSNQDSRLTAKVTANYRLTLQGSLDQAACYRVLKHWLSRKAEFHLVPWLRQVSREIDLPFNRVAIRGQKTLWASCSAKCNISLNYKLLFLPPHLVRYVFIHELCHTIHLNHSSQFWDLVAEKEPDFRLYDAELNKAWVFIPEWVERSSD
jgi:predicted metal-dependent hydrolase